MTKLVARPPFFLYPFIKCNRSRPPDLMWKEKLYKNSSVKISLWNMSSYKGIVSQPFCLGTLERGNKKKYCLLFTSSNCDSLFVLYLLVWVIFWPLEMKQKLTERDCWWCCRTTERDLCIFERDPFLLLLLLSPLCYAPSLWHLVNKIASDFPTLCTLCLWKSLPHLLPTNQQEILSF